MTNIPALALAEFTHRRRTAAQEVARCRMTPEQANLKVLFWAALAAHAGARLPEDVARMARNGADCTDPLAWWELRPLGVDPLVFLKNAQKELRRAAMAIVVKAENDPTPERLARARTVLNLDTHLAAPALGPLPLTLRADREEQRQAA